MRPASNQLKQRPHNELIFEETLIFSLNDKSHEISTSWSLSSGSRGKRSRGGHSSKSDLCLFFKLRPFRTFRKVDILPNLSSQSSHNLNNFHLFPSELQIYKIGEQQSFKILGKKALTNILVDKRIQEPCHGQTKHVWLWISMICLS